MTAVKDNNRLFLGLGFVGVGGFMLLHNFDVFHFHFSDLWPLIPTLFAIISWINFSRNPKDYELLMPASIFTVYSAMFWVVNFSYDYYMSDLWPLFILGPALGSWLMQISPYRKKDHTVAASVLTIIGLFFLINELGLLYGDGLLGIVFIMIGIVVIVKQRQKASNNDETNGYQDI